MIRKLLVANRGEIAVRVIRTARQMNIATVAIGSEADVEGAWMHLADEAVSIGPAAVRASYLNMEAVVRAGVRAGTDAVHPGYGLLSENADFARAIDAAGMRFVGPPADVIATMGDKLRARAAAVSCGVAVLPGTQEAVDADRALDAARRIGLPVVVKPAHGGGGRGIRLVEDEGALAAALAESARESAAAFGRHEVYVERYLSRARHVEVQLLADRHGTVLHLGDRDCSVQRRHQKLIEEAPAPALSPALRSRMQDAAVDIARFVGYRNAGTVEFLVDPVAGDVFFLEMNTRLQVEHGVTEMVTGLDLVEWQLRVAAGEAIAFRQDEVVFRGHAIQARIAAENPAIGFLPSTGPIVRLDLPGGPGVRCDFGVRAGDAVTGHYDSMIGKIMAWAPDRERARSRLDQALTEMRVAGPTTTAPYLRTVLCRPDFVAGTHATDILAQPGVDPDGWQPSALAAAPVTAAVSTRLVTLPWGHSTTQVAIEGGPRSSASLPTGGRDWQAAETSRTSAEDDGRVEAPMDAIVVSVQAEPGRRVGRGDHLLVLEAMKMQMNVVAPVAGQVDQVYVRPGDNVHAGTPLVTLLPASATP